MIKKNSTTVSHSMFLPQIAKSKSLPTWSQPYKTFYGRNLKISVIS